MLQTERLVRNIDGRIETLRVWIWFDFVYVHNINTLISHDHICVNEWLMMVLSPD